LVGSARFEELINQVRETYDAVILDCTPLLPVSDTLEVLPHVDAVVLCVRESQTTRDQASAAKAALSRWPGCPAGVVVTGIKPRGAGGDTAYAHAHSYA
jgi:Mrp family chromosome partitioning ATPase